MIILYIIGQIYGEDQRWLWDYFGILNPGIIFGIPNPDISGIFLNSKYNMSLFIRLQVPLYFI